MRTTLSILCSKGDLKITWDHADPESVAKARAEVEQLKLAGYTFYLVDGTPADEVAAGRGALAVKRLTVDEVVDANDEAGGRLPSTPPAAPAQEGEAKGKRRGRPPKAARGGQPDQSQGENREVIAVRPIRGG